MRPPPCRFLGHCLRSSRTEAQDPGVDSVDNGTLVSEMCGAAAKATVQLKGKDKGTRKAKATQILMPKQRAAPLCELRLPVNVRRATVALQ